MDGMLVWTNQPTKQDCLDVGIGERSFHCYRKDKFGMLLLAGSDAAGAGSSGQTLPTRRLDWV
jgi:hypothetical protein